MKSRNHLLLLLLPLLTLGLWSCEEVGPHINFEPEVVDTTLFDTTFVAATVPPQEPKRVLIEDFTGVRCVNCPAAQEEAAAIKAAKPERVVVVSLHAENNFTAPYEKSAFDFRSRKAESIINMLGIYDGLPIGAVDRLLFSGEDHILISKNKWAAYVAQQMQETTPVNLSVETEYDAAARELLMRVEAVYTDSASAEHYLSVQVLESDIVDWQLTPDGWQEDYIHNHTLRDMLTPYNGTLLDATLEPGRTFIKEFKLQVPEEYNDQALEVVAIIHERGGNPDVVQVTETEVE